MRSSHPFVRYSNVCARCGELWPEMFKVEDAEWKRYVQPDMRDRMLCRRCYDHVVAVTEAGVLERDSEALAGAVAAEAGAGENW